MISATVIGDSKNEFGDRLTTLSITFPRYILAELNTHRILSKNSASSRAIPFKRLLESVKENPYIPYAWQKDHKGMQGTEYFENETDINVRIENHLWGRDKAIQIAAQQSSLGITKQIVNRYLEPFMWHTVVISGTEWENFFSLRCPQYYNSISEQPFRSWKDLQQANSNYHPERLDEWSIIDKLKVNKGMADIHMMFLAEAIWDAMNESTPKLLKAGDWHIPYFDKLDVPSLQKPEITSDQFLEDCIKISTGMLARASYTVVGDEKEVSYETLIGIHDKMKVQVPFHASPFEHCALAMTEEQYYNWYLKVVDGREYTGWCRNFKGFIQYREIIESNNVNN